MATTVTPNGSPCDVRLVAVGQPLLGLRSVLPVRAVDDVINRNVIPGQPLARPFEANANILRPEQCEANPVTTRFAERLQLAGPRDVSLEG